MTPNDPIVGSQPGGGTAQERLTGQGKKLRRSRPKLVRKNRSQTKACACAAEHTFSSNWVNDATASEKEGSRGANNSGEKAPRGRRECEGVRYSKTRPNTNGTMIQGGKQVVLIVGGRFTNWGKKSAERNNETSGEDATSTAKISQKKTAREEKQNRQRGTPISFKGSRPQENLISIWGKSNDNTRGGTKL